MPRLALPTRNRKILLFIVALATLSFLDGALTIWGIRLGTIEEANPLGQWLIERGPVAFMAVKGSLPVILGFLLWRVRNRTHKLVTRLLLIAILAYAAVIIAHAHWIAVRAIRGSL